MEALSANPVVSAARRHRRHLHPLPFVHTRCAFRGLPTLHLTHPNRGAACSERMRTVWSQIALLLAILWMPLTAQCAIEASGILERDAGACCDWTSGCTGALCSAISKGEYKPVARSVEVFALISEAWPEPVSVSMPLPRLEENGAIGRTEHAPDWVASWHIVRRAVGLPRAPAVES